MRRSMREKVGNKARRSKILSSTASAQVDLFVNYLRQHTGETVVKEHQFHDTRKWRFDYAFPNLKVAIEVDGAVWTLGRHNRPAGYLADMEKLNTAASMGWLVLRITPDDRFLLTTRQIIDATLQYARSNNR